MFMAMFFRFRCALVLFVIPTLTVVYHSCDAYHANRHILYTTAFGYFHLPYYSHPLIMRMDGAR